MRAGSYCAILPLMNNIDPSSRAESDQFKPEKWLDGDFKNNKEFAAFGLGKRVCLGIKTAFLPINSIVVVGVTAKYEVQCLTRMLGRALLDFSIRHFPVSQLMAID